ncbi:type II toxin-antitoxin system HicA family toxin [Emcibacter nanhaiensis]|uniref:Type II toxin-antitoxin system HicA family toxin n=1 Tax=Emcibacter nanhaiensis TaxID=1505037 RepID=A0A501PH97_9PROT|nr:type II toxin-antitoxin system HicA family toxin [Emcibacter nanhaiensis]
MPDNFYRKLTKILKNHGYAFYRSGKGDHEIWRRNGTGRSISLPSKCPSRHTANQVLKQAGIDEKL